MASPPHTLAPTKRPAQVVLALLATLAASTAQAQHDLPTPPTPTQIEDAAGTYDGSPLAVAAAILPGTLVHGSGHFVLGDRKTAIRLLALEGMGLAGVIGGIGVLGAVGGSEKLAPVYVPLAVGGLTTLAFSQLADLLGSVRGTEPWPVPRHFAPATRASVAWTGLFGVPVTPRHLLEVRAEARGTRAALQVSATAAPTGGAWGGGATWSRRLDTPNADPVSATWLILGARHLSLPDDGVRLTTAEAFVASRWNLRDLAPTLQNAWVLARLGAAIDLFGYVNRDSWVEDGLPLLVVDAGMGARLTNRLTVEIAYRHRKDELPGGFTGSGLAGFLGFVEANGRVGITGPITLVPSVRWGRGVQTCIALESTF